MAKASIEVEMKAWAQDRAAIAERLAQTGRLVGTIDYRDTYFVRDHISGYTSERFRLRETAGRAWVTVKERLKETSGADAVREHDFEVSDPDEFRFFARAFGLKVLIEKRKRGERWALDDGQPGRPVTVELIEIEGLGQFVEIELMAETADEVPAASRRVLDAFARLSVPEADIETRPYTRMLYEKTVK